MREEIYTFTGSSEKNYGIELKLAGKSYCDGSYRINRPNSNTSCIEYIIKGTGTVIIDDKVYHPKEGDTYFLHQGKNQLYYSDKKNPWVKIWVNVSGKLLEDMIERYGLSNSFYFPGFYSKDILEQILRVAQEKKARNSLNGTLLVHELLYKLHNTLHPSSEEDSTAGRVKKYMEKRVEENIKVSQLSKVSGKSQAQLTRLFKKAYGITPYAYFLNLKIELAKNLLLRTNMAVKEISEYLSFTDEYYFSNVFKKQVGISPKHFRKE